MARLATSTNHSVKYSAGHHGVSIHLQNSGFDLSLQIQDTSILLVNLGWRGHSRAPVEVATPGCSLSMQTTAVDASFPDMSPTCGVYVLLFLADE